MHVNLHFSDDSFNTEMCVKIVEQHILHLRLNLLHVIQFSMVQCETPHKQQTSQSTHIAKALAEKEDGTDAVRDFDIH